MSDEIPIKFDFSSNARALLEEAKRLRAEMDAVGQAGVKAGETTKKTKVIVGGGVKQVAGKSAKETKDTISESEKVIKENTDCLKKI